MNKPHLEILPDPTDDAMDLLGASTIASVLGTYQHNLAERDRWLYALLQQRTVSPTTGDDETSELYRLWRAAERRLGLYQLLANEVGRS